MDAAWKADGLKMHYMQCKGELDESIWAKLEETMLADRATIAHDLAHLAALARGNEKAAALAEGHKARGIDSAVEAFVKRTVKETVNKDDGTTELKQLSKVNKPHLVQALLTLAAANNGSSVPDKKKLDALCRASLVQMVFEVVCAGLRPPSHEPGVGR